MSLGPAGLGAVMADPLLGPALLALSGVASGLVNTMAGGGTLLTLPLLLALGFPAGVANGTTRVGVLLQNVTAVVTFRRSGIRDLGPFSRLVGPMCVGAVLGAWLATRLDDALLRRLFGLILVLWAAVLILRPGRFLEPPAEPRRVGGVALAAAFAIGIYGGFLQAGVGFPLLALLVSGLGHAPVPANAIKVLLVLAYTLLAVPVFAAADRIAWPQALLLAAANGLGAYLGARWQLRAGATIVRWFVIVAVAASGALMMTPD